MTEPPMVNRLGGWRGLRQRAARAIALTWRSDPASATGYLVLTVVQGVIPAGLALLIASLLNDIADQDGHPDGTPPIALVVGIGVLGVTLAILPHVGDYLQARINRGVTLLVQERLYGSVNRFDGMSRFEDPGFLDRIRLAQQSATMAPDQVTRSLFGIIQSVLTVISFVGLLIGISSAMTAVTVLSAVPAIFVQLAIGRGHATTMWTTSPHHRRQHFYQTLMLDLAAVKEIRLFGLGEFFTGRMRRETLGINAAEERLDRRVLAGQAPLAILGAVVAAVGLVLLIGGAFGPVQVGDISIFIAAVAGAQGSMAGIISGSTSAYQALLVFGHYVDVVDMRSDLPSATTPVPVPALSSGLLIDDVWFRYGDTGPWVLRGVRLCIPFGGATALVGLNGAGKSTLVKLLCRFYDPTKGRITWDGIDIRRFDVAEYRDRVSAVFQDYMSYDLSARENIGVGDLRHLTDAVRITAAGRRAGADELVAGLPRGYDTMLSRIFMQDDDAEDSERGVTLSGGQWQRIALARAVLRSDRDLLILDEPSAGLDAAAEHAVHDRLRRYRDGATSVLISHRLGAVRDADRIVVLQEGRIVQQGTHARLMRSGGEYARLFRLQAAGYVDTGGRVRASD